MENSDKRKKGKKEKMKTTIRLYGQRKWEQDEERR